MSGRRWAVLPFGLAVASCSFLGLFDGSTVEEPCRSDADCQGGPFALDECVALVCGSDSRCHGLLRDEDGDGFASTECTDLPDEFTGLPEDCRDDDAAYSEPGQDVEVCDGVDNDCNGAVDEDPAAESCLGVQGGCSAGACGAALIVELAAGCDFTCARRANGDVECWGGRDVSPRDGVDDFPLGDAGFDDEDPRPVVVPRVHGAVDIGAGWHHACAALQDGRVVCWGRNREMQLGPRFPDFVDTQRPRPVQGLDDVVQVVAGYKHTCVRHGTGRVSCWGDGNSGQLGQGVVVDPRANPVEVLELADVTELAAGGGQRQDDSEEPYPEGLHTCAIEDGIVYCWGWNGNDQLAGFGEIQSASPVRIDLPGLAARVAANAYLSCAILEDTGEVACWGKRGSSVWVPPRLVPGLTDVSRIAAGLTHTCAVVASGDVFCWGEDALDQLGNTSDVSVDAPAPANLVD